MDLGQSSMDLSRSMDAESMFSQGGAPSPSSLGSMPLPKPPRTDSDDLLWSLGRNSLNEQQPGLRRDASSMSGVSVDSQESNPWAAQPKQSPGYFQQQPSQPPPPPGSGSPIAQLQPEISGQHGASLGGQLLLSSPGPTVGKGAGLGGAMLVSPSESPREGIFGFPPDNNNNNNSQRQPQQQVLQVQQNQLYQQHGKVPYVAVVVSPNGGGYANHLQQPQPFIPQQVQPQQQVQPVQHQYYAQHQQQPYQGWAQPQHPQQQQYQQYHPQQVQHVQQQQMMQQQQAFMQHRGQF